MRMLFTSISGYGSLHPLIPLALAAQTAGHVVAVATSAEMQPSVERLGFAFYPAGRDVLSSLRARTADLGDVTPAERQAHADAIFADLLVETSLPDLLAVCQRWSPDVVVRDHLAFGACLAAEERGIPHAAVDPGPAAIWPSAKRISVSRSRGGVRPAGCQLTPRCGCSTGTWR